MQSLFREKYIDLHSAPRKQSNHPSLVPKSALESVFDFLATILTLEQTASKRLAFERARIVAEVELVLACVTTYKRRKH